MLQSPFQSDQVKVKHHLDELFNEIRKMFIGHPDADAEKGMIAAMLGALCQMFDVQKVQNTMRTLVNDPRFWKQQQDSKAGKLIV